MTGRASNWVIGPPFQGLICIGLFSQGVGLGWVKARRWRCGWAALRLGRAFLFPSFVNFTGGVPHDPEVYSRVRPSALAFAHLARAAAASLARREALIERLGLAAPLLLVSCRRVLAQRAF